MNYFAHETAIVENGTEIGSGTKVWVNAQIRAGAIIGTNCIISKDTYIDASVKIGNNCKIQNSVSIYHGVTIEDDVFIGPNACFTNDKVPRAFDPDWKITPTLVQKGASIGANATIVCGVIIGEYALIGSGAVVSKDVKPYALMVGVPAKQIGWVSKAGNTLQFDENGVGFDAFDGSRYKMVDAKLEVIS